MAYVTWDEVGDGGWLVAARRAAGSARAPVIAGIALAALAMAELALRLVVEGSRMARAGSLVAVSGASSTSISAGQPPPSGAAGHVAQGGVLTGQSIAILMLLGLATTLPLGFLRRAAAAITISAACLVSVALFNVLALAGAGALLVALYRLGRVGRWPLALALSAIYLVLAFVIGVHSELGALIVLMAALAPAAGLAGAATLARGEAALGAEARLVAADTLIAHTARGERARIVRELHDIVAHHVSMVAVQAETARLTTAGMPEVGAERLLAIGDTARAALTEMRRLLGVLREDTETEAPQRQPQPGLRQLNELLDEARGASGVSTRLIISGAPAPLDPGVELAAYRIVQEALTNARRHAPGAAVDVELHFVASELRLRVRDNGPGPAGAAATGVLAAAAGAPGRAGAGRTAAPTGHGLLGMRERAAAVGGELRTGAAPGGGFLVRASLPADVGHDG